VKRGRYCSRKARNQDVHRRRQFIKSEAAGGRAKPERLKLSAIGEAIRRAAARGI
jgi:hypothetical protein